MLSLIHRPAEENDLPKIIEMLFDDPLGQSREIISDPIASCYTQAFLKIKKDKNQELMVVLHEEEIMATYQMTYIQYLNYQGALRAQVESVRVKKHFRGKGLGKTIFQEIIKECKKKGVYLLQLTSDKKRPDALRFYESLGFKASHQGLKLHLIPPS